jgi:signal transduction histidine kinase
MKRRLEWRFQPRALTVTAAVAGGLITLLVGGLPFVYFAYRSVEAHIALDSAETVVALVAAFLVYGRYRISRSIRDLVLVYALALLGCVNLAFSVVPDVISTPRPHTLSTWSAVTARLLGAAAFASSVFLPNRFSRFVRRPALTVIVSVAGSVIFAVLIVTFLQPFLSADVDLGISPETSSRPNLGSHPLLMAANGVQVLLYGLAAVGFTRRAQETGDELLSWLGAASTLAAWARVNYVLYPSLYSQWLYTGDLLRTGFYLTLLIGEAREIHRYWRRLAQVEVLEERRRMARDLHDGLAQELAYIVAQCRRLARTQSSDDVIRLEAAARRALNESRIAIDALTITQEEPLDVQVMKVVEDVAHRSGVSVRFELESGLDPSPKVRETVLRVTREAVTNAVSHGGARVVTVFVHDDAGIHLRVVDDGGGFDVAAPRRGFGLTSMRERVEGAGGSFAVHSTPGKGTEIEVLLP